jgi:hypothetical protein
MKHKIIFPYFSPNFIKGSTDWYFHFHIDVPKEERYKLFEIVFFLEKLGFVCAIDSVRISIGGPQRLELPGMYDLHNVPGDKLGGETLGAFSSTVVLGRTKFIHAIKSIIPQLANISGGIIEAEQPVGLCNNNGWELLVKYSEYILPIESDEIGIVVEKSMRLETHHWFSIPKVGYPLVNLQKLNTFLFDRGVTNTGGLFILDGKTDWGYASNSFSDDNSFIQRIQDEHGAYYSFLVQNNLPTNTLESLVENIVLVAKTESFRI